MDKTIDLVKDRLVEMLADFEAVALKAKEIAARSAEIAELLKKHIDVPIAKPAVDLSLLSPQEKQIFILIGQRLTMKEIGEKLNLSRNTCYEVRRRVQKKFGLKSTYDVVKLSESVIQNGSNSEPT